MVVNGEWGTVATWLKALPPDEATRARELLEPRLPLRYCGGQAPSLRDRRINFKQMLLLSPLFRDVKEILYGGAARGGKTSALMMDALQFVDVPGYSALLLRRSFSDLTHADSMLHRFRDWLGETDARYKAGDATWYFPSGATIQFGYLHYDWDAYRYKSSRFQFIAMDELTQFNEFQYRYMFSRLSRPQSGPLSRVPLRMRAGTNPDEVGHDWVKARFVTPFMDGELPPSREFIPAQLWDNPFEDQLAYESSVQELDPVTRAQLLHGDWSVTLRSGEFDRKWVIDRGNLIERHEVPEGLIWCRYWDRAGGRAKPGGRGDPDWTAGALLGFDPHSRNVYLADLAVIRESPARVEEFIHRTAVQDGPTVKIRIEQEPGASGVQSIEVSAGSLLGYDFAGDFPRGSKYERARPVMTAWYNGRFYVVRAAWNRDYFDECEAFPWGAHDDRVDAVSGAFKILVGPRRSAEIKAYVPWGSTED